MACVFGCVYARNQIYSTFVRMYLFDVFGAQLTRCTSRYILQFYLHFCHVYNSLAILARSESNFPFGLSLFFPYSPVFHFWRMNISDFQKWNAIKWKTIKKINAIKYQLSCAMIIFFLLFFIRRTRRALRFFPSRNFFLSAHSHQMALQWQRQIRSCSVWRAQEMRFISKAYLFAMAHTS